MSNTLRKYGDAGTSGQTMFVTAYVGQAFTPAVQFTIGTNYCSLAPNQIKDLITTLEKRLKRESGYKGTDSGEPKLVKPYLHKEKA